MRVYSGRDAAQRAGLFTGMYHGCYPRVLALIHRRVGDRGIAEDLTSEVFRIAWEHIGAGRLVNTAWLFATARDVLANHRRSVPRLVEPHRIGAADVSRSAVGAEDAGTLRALDALPEAQREVLRLRYWDGLDFHDAAAVVGCSRSAIQMRLHQARRAFRRAYRSERGATTSRLGMPELIARTNPLPTPPAGPLSGRAAAELTALVGEHQGAAFRPAPPKPARRGPILAAAVALVGILVIGLVLFFSFNRLNSSDEIIVDEWYHADTEELVGEADLILRGRIGATHRQTTDGIDQIRAEVTVLAAAGGSAAAGETLDVTYLAEGTAPSTVNLTEGGEYVLLLTSWDDGRFTLINSTQGFYRVDADRAIAGEHNEVGLGDAVLAELGLARQG